MLIVRLGGPCRAFCRRGPAPEGPCQGLFLRAGPLSAGGVVQSSSVSVLDPEDPSRCHALFLTLSGVHRPRLLVATGLLPVARQRTSRASLLVQVLHQRRVPRTTQECGPAHPFIFRAGVPQGTGVFQTPMPCRTPMFVSSMRSYRSRGGCFRDCCGGPHF